MGWWVGGWVSAWVGGVSCVPSSLYRLRKTKQKYILTDIHKQANRMTFGEVSRFRLLAIISIKPCVTFMH